MVAAKKEGDNFFAPKFGDFQRGPQNSPNLAFFKHPLKRVALTGEFLKTAHVTSALRIWRVAYDAIRNVPACTCADDEEPTSTDKLYEGRMVPVVQLLCLW